MTILVTGGAGYIGSHAVKELKERGYKVIVVDNLSTGFKTSLDSRTPFYEVSLHEEEKLYEIMTKENVDAVMHFAAFSLVEESVNHPLKYYRNNVEGTRSLLEAMLKAKVYTIIFSSTAAVYGDQAVQPITETAALQPKNPYGETKLAIEKMLESVRKVTPLNYIALRYFNVAGAHKSGLIGENHNPETHLIPNLLKASLGSHRHFVLYGTDHDTHDGTAVRDYVHVEDLVEAHILALKYCVNHKVSDVFNLGTETGYSVKEILELTKTITKQSFKVEIKDKRAGDPKALVASYKKAKDVLGWEPHRGLKTMIQSAYNYYKDVGIE